MKKVLVILILLNLTACAFIKSTSSQSEGNKINRDHVEEIKPGITAKSSIIDTFGNPATTESKPDGAEVLTYTYREKKTPTYLGEFIVNERGSHTTTITLEIIIKDGLVLSYSFKKQEE
ncbi:MAG: hypothetical protein HY026_02400 [Deltaproteobacteria bacterium]|nr:hypothetical protein [Deltaproteobacteria bacterium]